MDIGPSQNAVESEIWLELSSTPDLLLRLAWFRATKRRLLGEQTLEPTQIAGFNQFYDDQRNAGGNQGDWPGLRTVPTRLCRRVNLIERLKVPQSFTQFTDYWYENGGLAYLYWVLSKKLVATVDDNYERFDRWPISSEQRALPRL